MGSRFKLVILDFDGTVVNTMPALTDIAVALFVEFYDLEEDEARSHYLNCIGAPFSQQLTEMFSSRSVNQEVARIFEQQKPSVYVRAKLCEGVLEALTLLHQHGVSIAICSSTREILVYDVMQRFALSHLGIKITGNMGGDDKEYQIKELVAENHVLPEETIFIGDAPRDGWYAQWAGVKFLGVEHTVGHEAFIKQAGHSVLNILEAVKEILEA